MINLLPPQEKTNYRRKGKRAAAPLLYRVVIFIRVISRDDCWILFVVNQ